MSWGCFGFVGVGMFVGWGWFFSWFSTYGRFFVCFPIFRFFAAFATMATLLPPSCTSPIFCNAVFLVSGTLFAYMFRAAAAFHTWNRATAFFLIWGASTVSLYTLFLLYTSTFFTFKCTAALFSTFALLTFFGAVF